MTIGKIVGIVTSTAKHAPFVFDNKFSGNIMHSTGNNYDSIEGNDCHCLLDCQNHMLLWKVFLNITHYYRKISIVETPS